ncbi:MAG: prevent-host-death protein [Pseudonocardiales bacterium]|nr:MAG: prevent-host-death protein [Pseudonocardiales bacterium]
MQQALQIPVTQARAQLAELVTRVAYAGERVTLQRHGRALAAIVSVEDLRRLEELPVQAAPPQQGDFGFARQEPTPLRRRDAAARGPEAAGDHGYGSSSGLGFSAGPTPTR